MIKVRPNLPAAAKLLHDGQKVFSEMEHHGIRVDVKYLKKLTEDIEKQVTAYKKELMSDKVVWCEWRKVYDDKAKLGSKQQLADIIFNRLGHEKAEGKKNKQRSEDSGDSSKRESQWDEASFSKCDLPFVKTYFQWQKVEKLRGTYLAGIYREMIDGRVHPQYNLNIPISYRSSCDTPNFQNIPVRNKKIAEMIRKCYIASEGNYLVEADYGGAEVRVSACYNNDSNLIRYLTEKNPDGSDKNDMHRDMAAFIFMMKTDFLIEHKAWAKKVVRDWSKNRLVFPMFYGSVYVQCAPDLWRAVLQHARAGEKMPDGKETVREYLKRKGIKKLGECEFDSEPKKGTFAYRVKEAEDYLWNTMFPEYTAWKKEWYQQYLRRGWFAMHTGFVVEGLMKKNDVLNYSIQGSAFHCTLQAMVWINRELKRLKMKSRIVGQIHDCIIGDVPPRELQAYLNIVRDIMAVRLPREWKWIIVPMEVEAEVCDIGASWYEKKVWQKIDQMWQLPQPA